MTPEGKIKDKIKALLEQHGAYYFMPVPMGFGKRTLDFLVCHRGRFLAIEAKRPGKEPTPFQRNTMNEIRQADGHVLRVNDEETLALLSWWLRKNGD